MTVANPVVGDAATMIGDLLRTFPEADTTPEARCAWYVRTAERLGAGRHRPDPDVLELQVEVAFDGPLGWSQRRPAPDRDDGS